MKITSVWLSRWKKNFWDAKLTQQIHKGQRIFSGNLAALTHQSDSKQQDKQDEIGCHFQAQMTWSIKSIPCIPFCSVDTLICQCLSALFIVSYLYLTNVDTSVARDQSFFRLWSVVFKDNLLPQGRLGPNFVSGWPCSSQGTRLKELDSSIVNKSKLRKK